MNEEKLGWQEEDIFLFGHARERFSKSLILIEFISVGGSILIFALFCYSIILLDVSITCAFLLFSLDLLFLLKCVQTILFWEYIMIDGRINLKALFFYPLPVIILLIFLVYVLFVNIPFDLINNISYATEDPIAVSLPILISAGIIISIPITIYKKAKFKIDPILVRRREMLKDEPYDNLNLYLYHHIELSFLSLLVVPTIFNLLEINLFITILSSIALILLFNFIYYNRHKNEKELSVKPEKVIKEKKEGYVSIKNIFLIFILTISVVFYFALKDFQFVINRIIEILFFNPFMFTLLIINIVLFVLSPIVKFFGLSSKKIASKIYHKFIFRYFYALLFSLIIFFAIKITLFNLHSLNLSTTTQWLISLTLSAIIFVLSIYLISKSSKVI